MNTFQPDRCARTSSTALAPQPLNLPKFYRNNDYTVSGRHCQRSSNSIGLKYPLVECLLIGLKNWSMYSLTMRRAWLSVANLFLRSSSHSSVLKKLSATALSQQSPFSLIVRLHVKCAESIGVEIASVGRSAI